MCLNKQSKFNHVSANRKIFQLSSLTTLSNQDTFMFHSTRFLFCHHLCCSSTTLPTTLALQTNWVKRFSKIQPVFVLRNSSVSWIRLHAFISTLERCFVINRLRDESVFYADPACNSFKIQSTLIPTKNTSNRKMDTNIKSPTITYLWLGLA